MSFYLQEYAGLLDLLQASGRKPARISDAAGLAGVLKAWVVLRHDVDRMPERALAMAELETSRSMVSTYYFRCSGDGHFPDEVIRRIASLGHETGYHYECLTACGGDRHRAMTQFAENLKSFRRIAPCASVAMHGAPLSRYDNNDLLRDVALEDFDLIADATHSFRTRRLAYFTDTGGRWNAGVNLRDRVGLDSSEHPPPFSPEFGPWLASYDGLAYISAHPERWASTAGDYAIATARDAAANAVKLLLGALRRQSAAKS